MKKLILAVAMLLASVGHAEVFSCTFTEPFLKTAYDTSNKTFTTMALSPKGNKVVTVISGVELQSKSANAFSLVAGEVILQTLTLDNQGSDGMSDIAYPYSAKTSADLIGGCFSGELK